MSTENSLELEINEEFDGAVDLADEEVASASVEGHDNEDVNEVSTENVLNVVEEADLDLDDVTIEKLAIGSSFNGSGNDSQFRVSQANNLVDNDLLIDPEVVFESDEEGVFAEATAEGGDSDAGDGISGDFEDEIASENAEDGTIDGDALATAEATAEIDVFNQDIVMGDNTQGNTAKIEAVGGDSIDANDIEDAPAPGADAEVSSFEGNDVNDIDSSDLINVEDEATLEMDDFSLDVIAIGDSFNGPGNDMQFDVGQVNDLVDNDELYNPEVSFDGDLGDEALLDADATGGTAEAGDGVSGDFGSEVASANGGSGSVLGSTTASTDAFATIHAFNQNIVMGANLQLNSFTADVVGGDSTVANDIDFAS
jgi:hypothetical protein